MKQTIMSRLEEIYRSVPAHITDDEEVMLRIAHAILCESSAQMDGPAWLVADGIEDWRAEKRLIEAECVIAHKITEELKRERRPGKV